MSRQFKQSILSFGTSRRGGGQGNNSRSRQQPFSISRTPTPTTNHGTGYIENFSQFCQHVKTLGIELDNKELSNIFSRGLFNIDKAINIITDEYTIENTVLPNNKRRLHNPKPSGKDGKDTQRAKPSFLPSFLSPNHHADVVTPSTLGQLRVENNNCDIMLDHEFTAEADTNTSAFDTPNIGDNNDLLPTNAAGGAVAAVAAAANSQVSKCAKRHCNDVSCGSPRNNLFLPAGVAPLLVTTTTVTTTSDAYPTMATNTTVTTADDHTNEQEKSPIDTTATTTTAAEQESYLVTSYIAKQYKKSPNEFIPNQRLIHGKPDDFGNTFLPRNDGDLSLLTPYEGDLLQFNYSGDKNDLEEFVMSTIDEDIMKKAFGNFTVIFHDSVNFDPCKCGQPATSCLVSSAVQASSDPSDRPVYTPTMCRSCAEDDSSQEYFHRLCSNMDGECMDERSLCTACYKEQECRNYATCGNHRDILFSALCTACYKKQECRNYATCGNHRDTMKSALCRTCSKKQQCRNYATCGNLRDHSGNSALCRTCIKKQECQNYATCGNHRDHSGIGALCTACSKKQECQNYATCGNHRDIMKSALCTACIKKQECQNYATCGNLRDHSGTSALCRTCSKKQQCRNYATCGNLRDHSGNSALCRTCSKKQECQNYATCGNLRDHDGTSALCTACYKKQECRNYATCGNLRDFGNYALCSTCRSICRFENCNEKSYTKSIGICLRHWKQTSKCKGIVSGRPCENECEKPWKGTWCYPCYKKLRCTHKDCNKERGGWGSKCPDHRGKKK